MGEIDLKTLKFIDMERGFTASASRKVTRECIWAFMEATGDRNPIHWDEEFARKTPFKRCIAHGMLTAGHISALFGQIPGAIYKFQDLNFRSPVFVGDTVVTSIEVHETFHYKKRVRFHCMCRVGARVVLDGDSMLQFES